MFGKSRLNIYDFDIYSKRISFFYRERDKIGTVFGLFLTFLYVTVTLILFIYYLIRTIERADVKSQESTIYIQGIPSFELDRKVFYFAFGLENPLSLIRYIDERIYYPKVYFIQQNKENGVLVTKKTIDLKIERCQIEKFGEEYKAQFGDKEINNSYCLDDLNLTLGGSQYEQSSFLQIEIYPCINTTENKNQCKQRKKII